jgi:hypothetical protein
MGGVMTIPSGIYLEIKQEERSLVGTQRIISIPSGISLHCLMLAQPPANPDNNFKTCDSITPFRSDKRKLKIVNCCEPIETIDKQIWIEYVCVEEALVSQSEQRARVGTQRCTSDPLTTQERLVRRILHPFWNSS